MATLTKKGAETRGRIVDAAAVLIRSRGASDTSLDDIRDATSTSKSQLFHYFPGGREDLLTAVAEHEAQNVLAVQQPWLDELGTDESWRGWRRAVLDHYVALGSRCPLGSLTAELGKSSPRSQRVVTTLYDTWQHKLSDGVVRRTQDRDRTLGPLPDPEKSARALLASIQGGVLMLGVTERVSYLRDALDTALIPLDLTPEWT